MDVGEIHLGVDRNDEAKIEDIVLFIGDKGAFWSARMKDCEVVLTQPP